jgi:ribosomal protection tetracycline resistance protein
VGTLNLGILAHVDAGKTSLTERLLFDAGVIGAVGRVDDGTTQTDTLALERQRGITIKSAVVSFAIGGVTVNLIDTPGHPDFIAEVERVLRVLDGAVLVISAVEGVQAQTRVLMRVLQRLRIPTLVFVNKIDRGGADGGRVLRDVAGKLTPAVIAMGQVDRAGTREAGFTPYGAGDAAFTGRLAELLAEHDDALLAAYLGDEAAAGYGALRRQLAAQTGQALVHPVFFGSAITGAGVAALAGGIAELLPVAGGDPGGPVRGTVFKVDRGAAGEKIAYVRMFSGTVRARERVPVGRNGSGRITGISVFGRGTRMPAASASAGQIALIRGLGGVRIGDTLGQAGPGDAGLSEVSPSRAGGARRDRYFAPPTLETVVAPCRPGDKGALHLALTQLAEQDPLINLRQDDIRGELYVSLYGEVQKEVIGATLAGDFGLAVTFRETTTICIERLTGEGAATEMLRKPPNPFLAGVGLAIAPAPAGSGVEFRLGIEPGSLPVPFRKAVEETVRQTLRQGIHGWEVADCSVTLTHSGYIPPQGKRGQAFDASISSTAGDFRHLTPLVLMSALTQAGTVVCEPMHRFHLEIPAGTLAATLPALGRLGGAVRTQAMRGPACVLEGEVPAAAVHRLQQELPALTRGEGLLECSFARYQPVTGAVPARARTDHNPLNRKEYLLHVMRGVPARR